MNMHKRQNGWIASFLIIGTVLVLGLLGTVYFVKTRSATTEIASRSEESSKSDTSFDKPKKDDVVSSDTKKEEKIVDKNAQSPTKDASDTKESEPTPDSEPAVDIENNDISTQKVEDSDKELPATGPGGVGAQFVAVMALVVSSAFYLQSRRGL